jgi:hypothetical protein
MSIGALPGTLAAVAFAGEGQTGVAVGLKGALIFTRDGGKTWHRRTTSTDADLRAVAFSDQRHGWIGGEGGTLLATEDGGETWFRATRPVPPNAVIDAAERAKLHLAEAREHYHIFPAPWYYLCLVLVGLSLVPALRRPEPVLSSSPSVADRLVTDRPIESGDTDAFDLGSVALGLSRFLRNEKTRPPLTLAVTGEWGSGKSSLMNLLRADIVRYGFRPVCFNAWHHQKEEHLLASLLEMIRSQGLPAWWRPEGAIFRARLLRLRWTRFWPVVVLLALPFAGSLGYVWAHPEQIDHFLDALGHLDAKNPDGWLQTFVWKPLAAADRHGAVVTLFISLGGLLLSIWRGAKGFGVNPASLLARDSGRLKDLSALTGFRHRFAAEFREISQALNPRTMLILIDDLDRCRAEMVLEVLEAVNFLVSSGDCFVVLGMARDRVVRCVGLSFKDVAGELLAAVPGLAAGLSPEDLARQRRLEYAQQYLEKLINIEVPVPIPTALQTRQILVAKGVEEEAPPSHRASLLQQGRAALRWAAPLLLFTALVAVGFWSGATQGLPHPPSLPSQAGTAVTRGPVAASSSTDSQPALPPSATSPVEVDPAEEAHRPAWLLAPLLLLLLGLGGWRLSIPPDIVLRDSEEFETALAAWHPLVVAFRNTPRSVKRFLNRVRYLAMLQRRQPPEPTGWQRLLGQLRRRPAPPKSEESPIPERALVALAAIEQSHPEWLEEEELFRDAMGFLRTQTLPPGLQEALDNPFLLPSLEPYREAYLQMSRGIHVS